jgi:hypothetical protein
MGGRSCRAEQGLQMGRELCGAKSSHGSGCQGTTAAARQNEISDRVTLKQDDASRVGVGAATGGAAIEERCEGVSMLTNVDLRRFFVPNGEQAGA